MICRDCKGYVPSLIVLIHGGISQCLPCHQLFKWREKQKRVWVD